MGGFVGSFLRPALQAGGRALRWKAGLGSETLGANLLGSAATTGSTALHPDRTSPVASPFDFEGMNRMVDERLREMQGPRGAYTAQNVPLMQPGSPMIAPPEDPKIAELKRRKIIRADAPSPLPSFSPFAQAGAVGGANIPRAEDSELEFGPANGGLVPEQEELDVFGTVGGELARGRRALLAMNEWDASKAATAAAKAPTPQRGIAGAVQGASEVFPQSAPEPGEKVPDVFLTEDLDEQWRFGPLNDREIKPRHPHEPPRDTVGAVSEPGPVKTAASGGNDEAPRVLMSSGGRTYNYQNSARLPAELRAHGGRGNVSQLGISGNPLVPAPVDPALQSAIQSRSREALVRGLEDPDYLEDQRYRRRKEIDEEYRSKDKEEVRGEAKNLLKEYEEDVAAMRAEGGDDIEERITQATDALNRELASLGIRPYIPPKRY
jgi:hypothetical protein